MIVEQRRGDIELRSMGASRFRRWCYCMLGTLLGVVGTLAGVAAGLAPVAAACIGKWHWHFGIRPDVSIFYLFARAGIADLLLVSAVNWRCAVEPVSAWRAMG